MMRGCMEAIFDDIPEPTGLMKFAPSMPARGSMFGAVRRAGGNATPEAVVSEKDLYG
jgi:hypothetical protein